jgi:hypothetical protein
MKSEGNDVRLIHHDMGYEIANQELVVKNPTNPRYRIIKLSLKELLRPRSGIPRRIDLYETVNP